MNTVDNAALVEAGLATVKPTLMPMELVKRGKGFVHVQKFAGTGSASAIKAALKAANPKLSAKALKGKVLETLRGERDFREQLASAWLQGQYQDGLIPSHGERGKSGGCLRLVHAPEPKVAAAVVPETKESLQKALEALQAKLAAMA